MLDRLAADGVRAPLSLSLSPTLLCMLGDALLRERFADHVTRTRVLAEREAVRLRGDAGLGPVIEMYLERLEETAARWQALDGDLVGALVAHAEAGRLELMTTA